MMDGFSSKLDTDKSFSKRAPSTASSTGRHRQINNRASCERRGGGGKRREEDRGCGMRSKATFQQFPVSLTRAMVTRCRMVGSGDGEKQMVTISLPACSRTTAMLRPESRLQRRISY